MEPIALRPAVPRDVPGITECVCEAYIPLIERVGRQPGPMVDDYMDVLRHCQVHVAVTKVQIIGVVVLAKTHEGLRIDNIAVRPAFKGRGIGLTLLEFAETEARRQGYDSIYLYTNESLVENIELYCRIGYVEYDRRPDCGFPRVFMRKPLIDTVARPS
ncbi:MAG: GNAT family N-acetyltransferase [Burkholderiaceae bacterium]